MQNEWEWMIGVYSSFASDKNLQTRTYSDQAGDEWFVTQNSNSKLKPKPEPLFFFLQTNKQTKPNHWPPCFDNGISAAAATPQPPAPPACGGSDRLRRFLLSSHSIRAPLLARSFSVRYRSSPSPTPLRLSRLSLSLYIFTLSFFTYVSLAFILSLSIRYADWERRWSNRSTNFSCSG